MGISRNRERDGEIDRDSFGEKESGGGSRIGKNQERERTSREIKHPLIDREVGEEDGEKGQEKQGRGKSVMLKILRGNLFEPFSEC